MEHSSTSGAGSLKERKHGAAVSREAQAQGEGRTSRFWHLEPSAQPSGPDCGWLSRQLYMCRGVCVSVCVRS